MKQQIFCPYCSMNCVVVGYGLQLQTGIGVTAIHCNKCNKTTRLLGVKL